METGARSSERVARIFKTSHEVRVGISFQKDSAPMYVGEGTVAHREGVLPPVVRAVHPTGLAAQAGLCVGDMVTWINGIEAVSNLDAAAMLRDAVGDVEIRYIPRAQLLGPPAVEAEPADAHERPAVAPLDLGSVGEAATPRAAEGIHGGDFTSRFFAEANRLFEETSKHIGALGLTSARGPAPASKPAARAAAQPASARSVGSGGGGGGGGLNALISNVSTSLFGPDKPRTATRLQTAYRAYRARRVFATHRWAAIVLQSAARGRADRAHALQLREARREYDAAACIQSGARGRAARKTAGKLRAKQRDKPGMRRVLSFNRKKGRDAPAARPTAQQPPPAAHGERASDMSSIDGGGGGGGGLLRRLSFKRAGKKPSTERAEPERAQPAPQPRAAPPVAASADASRGGGLGGGLRRTLSFGKK